MSFDFDLDEGKPAKLKNVSISEIETRFAKVVDDLVSGRGKIEASLTSIKFEYESAELVVRFNQKISNNF
ncbi:hypothetical protein [Oceanimonas smirnovii]|uniref:hypothetical protein n=1 Tax=Oceanimonas smirnovii TaxID=264574 RepID=UPI003FD1A920